MSIKEKIEEVDVALIGYHSSMNMVMAHKLSISNRDIYREGFYWGMKDGLTKGAELAASEYQGEIERLNSAIVDLFQNKWISQPELHRAYKTFDDYLDAGKLFYNIY